MTQAATRTRPPSGVTRPFAAYHGSFQPKDYIREYYSLIGMENEALLRFFASAYAEVPRGAVMLEFGGGPTIYQLISAAKHVREIHFSDYLQENLEAVQGWVDGRRDRYDWSPFFARALEIENGRKASAWEVAAREELVREKVTRFALCDAHRADPLGLPYRGYYDVVAINFVAESITHSPETWKTLCTHMFSLVKPGGTLLMTAILNAEYYTVGRKIFPAAPLTEEEIVAFVAASGFGIRMRTAILAEVERETVSKYTGYDGMLFLGGTLAGTPAVPAAAPRAVALPGGSRA